MNEEIRNILGRAILIIKSCRGLLLTFFIVYFFQYSFILYSSEKNQLLRILPFLFLIILKPIAYGRYIEILNGDNHISYAHLLKLHWKNFYIVCILIALLAVPIVFILSLFFLNNSSLVFLSLMEIILNILSIYIIPLVFILRERIKPISLGLKCIIGNPGDSLYLIILTLAIYAVGISYANYGVNILGSNKFMYLFFGTVITFASLLIDFTVFVAASIILNKKLFNR